MKIAVLRAVPPDAMRRAVPALRALRLELPDAHVTLIGLPAAAAFAARLPLYVDDFVALPLESRALALFLATMHERKFDVAIPMQGGRAANVLLELIGVRRFALTPRSDRRSGRRGAPRHGRRRYDGAAQPS